MVKFLPSYVGSKAYWVDELKYLEGLRFVEVFAGSATLSASLAGSAILNDTDPYIFKMLNRYNELIVPDVFTYNHYMQTRKKEDWWKYLYCLQKMSFSGVFRYSKNGYNVPIKKKYKDESVKLANEFKESLSRWKELSPEVFNLDYKCMTNKITPDCVLIIDPPYEKGQASYNTKFDYHQYWEWVRLNENSCRVVVLFDYDVNLPFKDYKTRRSRVNGAKRGSNEAMFIFEDSLKEGQKGEEVFAEHFKDRLERLDGIKNDFLFDGKWYLELKSDYYDMERTPNFFMERYSDRDRKKEGGPWQALINNNKYYVYYFPKNGVYFSFETKELVSALDSIVEDLELVDIPNKSWVTQGYKVNRDLLKHICKKKHIK